MSFDFTRLYPYSDEEAASSFYEIWVTRQGNAVPVLEFASALDSETYRKLRQMLVKTADEGKITNKEFYRHIDEGVYEFKFRVSRLYSFNDGRRVVLTHGAKKRSDRAADDRQKVCAIRVLYFEWRKGNEHREGGFQGRR
jgi:hypothetical protein